VRLRHQWIDKNLRQSLEGAFWKASKAGPIIVAGGGDSMRRPSAHNRIHRVMERIKRMFKRAPEPPEDPYAYVGAPKKPRPPHRSGAQAEPLD
jgi:hypothetical protein